MPGDQTTEHKKNGESTAQNTEYTHLQKQIDEIRNSAVALYNIMEKKGITNEKEFMEEYKAVSLKKEK